MEKLVVSSLILLSLASVSLADVAKPDKPKKPPKGIDTWMYIKLDRDATKARLIIPRSQLQQLRAELDQIDGDTSTALTFAATQTIVSGALLSLAFVFGGLWFVRSSARNSTSAAAASVLLALGSVAAYVHGNAGPPTEARSITGKMFTQAVHLYKQGSGDIKLEVSDDVETPELIVPDKPAASDE